MKTETICGIFVILFLTQGTFGKPTQETVDPTETETDHTAVKELLNYAFDQFMVLGREYISKCAEVCHNMLKDESLMANNESKVVEFKNFLKLFVEENDKQAKNDVFTIWIFIADYLKTVKSLAEISEEKKTTESEFILEILNKYDYQIVNTEYRRKFDAIVDNFMSKFEEHNEEMNAEAQEWFKEFKSLTKFEDKLGGVATLMYIFEKEYKKLNKSEIEL